MAIKFLEQKERQETMVYIVAFVVILTALIHFVGVDFNFEQPEVTPKGRENFLEIKTTLDQIEEHHEFDRFRNFTPIPPLEDVPRRDNPFHVDGADIVNDSPTPEREDGDIFQAPGNAGENEEIR